MFQFEKFSNKSIDSWNLKKLHIDPYFSLMQPQCGTAKRDREQLVSNKDLIYPSTGN